MIVDGTSLIKRANIFMAELKARRYPNSTKLAELASCSRNTAQRTIYRLRDEYMVPLEYDDSQKGYFLKDPKFELPQFLPPGKDELTALLLLRDLSQIIDSKDLQSAIDSIWNQFVSRNSGISAELEPLSQVFSSEITSIGDLTDLGILDLVRAAHVGESVELKYKSPWRHAEPKVYRGKILRVHFSDGHLYLLFLDSTGRELILNASFIRDLNILKETVKIATGKDADTRRASYWLDGFGVWSGEEPELVEIRLLPPAAQYYAAQRWHVDQEDSWDGDTLVRKMQAIVSPEIARRILSLGRFVEAVKPKRLAEIIAADAKGLLEALG